MDAVEVQLESLPSLGRDVRKLAANMTANQARGLVDLYYQLQDFRIQANNQTRALIKTEEPHETIDHFYGQFFQLEGDIQKALDTYSNAQELGAWARLHVGVGPVIAAGLLAHIPIEKTPMVSSLWRFAGLAPGQKYVKGQKRDWNARLKVLCWKLGDSFVKQSGRDNCYYGKLYRQRKEKEAARNEAVREVSGPDYARGGPPVEINGHWFVGGNAQAAAKALTERTIKDAKLRATLHSGKLPDVQIDLRARRYAVKRFLAHYWEAAWWLEYGTEPPRAYVFEHLGHVDVDPCPIPYPRRQAA